MRRTSHARLGRRAARGAALAVLAAAWPGPAAAEVIDRIAAVVNESVITLRDARRAALPLLAAVDRIEDPARRDAEEQAVLRRTIDELVGQTLMLQEAMKLKLDATAPEIDAWLDNLKRQYGWSDEDLGRAIESQGTSLTQYREDVRKRIVTNRVVQVKLGSSVRVSDQDVEDTYQREYGGRAEEPEITARHILLLVPDGADATQEAEKRALATKLLAELTAGRDFAAAAREHSEGPSRVRGGDLGTFKPGSLDPEFERAALAAAVGEVVGPVRTRFGFHLIQVVRRRVVQTRDADEVRGQIRARLRQKGLERQLQLWVEELKRAAFVDVRI